MGFAFWLAHALDGAGYISLPAKDIRGASELAMPHGIEWSLVVIDPSLPSARRFVEGIRKFHPRLKAVAALADDVPAPIDLAGFDAALMKPGRRTAEAVSKWLDAIRALSPPDSVMPQAGA